MTHEQFEILLEATQKEDREILSSKNAEYAPGDDKLANFKKSARSLGVTPEQCLWYFCQKHLTSIQDIVNGEAGYTPERLKEKAGDARRYMILLEGLMLERHT